MTAPDTATAIRTLIVDDEALARDLLRRFVARDPDLECVGEAASGREALTQARRLKPDLVLLDVQMPPPDGLEVASELATLEYPPPWIVFVTAFDRHAVRAFELEALDYLVKPIGKVRFEQAIARAKSALRTRNVVNLTERLLASAAGHPARADSPATSECLTIRKGEQVIGVPVNQIEWVEADNQYVRIHVGGRTHVLPCSMTQFERRIGDGRLVRVHRSALVNPEFVAKLWRRGNGLHALELTDGTRIPIARSRRSLVTRFVHRLGRSVR
jgi:two-component system LytT family response regulator